MGKRKRYPKKIDLRGVRKTEKHVFFLVFQFITNSLITIREAPTFRHRSFQPS